MEYKSVVFTPQELASQFICGIGSDFTTIRNTSPLPPLWDTEDIDTLAEVAGRHLTLVIDN